MIEFIEDTHTYLVNGVITPSVSTILGSTIFSNKYYGVKKETLDAAASFGTNVHKAIELDNPFGLDSEEMKAYDTYLELTFEEGIKPVSQEMIVHYGEQYAGTLDMIANWNGVLSLGDIKTTYQLDTEYLSWQLSLYEKAYCDLFKKPKFEKLFCIWLPKKRKGKVVEIKRKTGEEINELLKNYYKLYDL